MHSHHVSYDDVHGVPQEHGELEVEPCGSCEQDGEGAHGAVVQDDGRPHGEL